MTLKFHFITLFPEVITPWLTTSIIGRAHESGLFEFQTYQLRDFTTDKHRTVDDVAYGGGGGMVLKVEPLVACWEQIKTSISPRRAKTIYFSPQGKRLNVSLLQEMGGQEISDFILICGHYEGVDQRFIEGWVDEQISLGDFVITGGELPALAFVDALVRQTGKALGREEAHEWESFSLTDEFGRRLLEYPHYTRPQNFQGKEVPEILLTGDHKKIAQWRKEQSIQTTREKRPDLI